MTSVTDPDSPPATHDAPLAAGRPRLRRATRRIGTVLVVLGVLFLAYGAAVYFWRDPVTDLYARWKQHGLSSELDSLTAEYRAAAPATVEPALRAEDAAPGGVGVAALEEATRAAAVAFYRSLELGQPIGRIAIPRLDIDPVVVNGTRWGADLSRGPGRYTQTKVPGMGAVTAIAGHRTTFGAPFRHIDQLERGDAVTLELPYGTFRYVVVGHEIVDDGDWSVIRPRGFDLLVLSACHPLYSASQRWIVYARLAEVELPGGQSYRVPGAPAAAAA